MGQWPMAGDTDDTECLAVLRTPHRPACSQIPAISIC